MALPSAPMTNVTSMSLAHVCCNCVCAVLLNLGELAREIHKDHKNVAKSAILTSKCVIARVAIEILSCQPPQVQVQLDCTHAIAAHMGQAAPKDMLVTFVIGADEWQCHKNPIVTIIIRTNRFKRVVHCSETGGGPRLEEFLALLARFKPPPKRQPNSFNCWFLLGWCGNLFA